MIPIILFLLVSSCLAQTHKCAIEEEVDGECRELPDCPQLYFHITWQGIEDLARDYGGCEFSMRGNVQFCCPITRPQAQETSCPKLDHILCENTQQCIPISYLCDGDTDCSDNFDENSLLCHIWKTVDSKEATTTPPNGISGRLTNLESTLNSVQEEVCSKPSLNELQILIESSDESLNTTLDNNLSEISENISTLHNKLSQLDNKLSQLADWFLMDRCFMEENRYFDHSCYYFSSSLKYWNDAQSDCINNGGNLVKIDSEAEFNFIKGEISGTVYWIGLNDHQTEGEFQWVSEGTNAVLPADWWWAGEPDNSGGNQDCVYIYNGRFLDTSCTSSLKNYICEMTL